MIKGGEGEERDIPPPDGGEGEGTLCKGRELLRKIEGQVLPWR